MWMKSGTWNEVDFRGVSPSALGLPGMTGWDAVLEGLDLN